MAASTRVTAAGTHARASIGRRSAAPLALFLLTLAIYLATLTQVHTFDALSYVTSVERKPWTEVFHPHHLAYGPLGVLALEAGRALGYTGGAALPMQIVNALAGALGVAWFYTLVRRVTSRTDLASTCGLLLGGGYAYWYYAVEIEVYTVATLFLIICLDILARPAWWRSRQNLLALGLAQAGAVLFHQTNVLLCAPILVMLGAHLRGERRKTKDEGSRTEDGELRTDDGADRRIGRWSLVVGPSIYAVALALAVGLPYLIVGLGISGFRSWAAFDAWLTEYARTGWWGGPITARKWAALATGLGDTLAQPGGALLGLLLLGLLLAHLRALLGGPRPLVAGLVAWLLTYGSFFLWWEPDNIEFWIASLPPALLLLALALRSDRQWGPGVWLALAIGITATGVNYDSIARRGDPATDLQRVIARELGARSGPADLLLVPDGLLELYLPYYERHDNFLSLNQALFDNGNDWGRSCVAVRTRMGTALHAGAAVYLADEVLRPPALLLERHHLLPEQVTACFAPYGGALQFVPLPGSAPAYWRLAMGQPRAEGSGWRFDSFAEGWQAANVQQELFAQGWHFVPGSDPSLTSPLFDIDAERFSAIEVRMANGTAARDAQLFFAGPDGTIDEARSARWTLEPGTAAATYRIDLAEIPGWRGRITRLRLDPVGVGDGGQMRVEWVRLVPR
ncbi:MAG TPA: glycosyltransferase family 39 protein [Roseiflexaceae bacterium]|nr:glycosyltransferase family 39 protein [Roseiflexaceae bacterium]